MKGARIHQVIGRYRIEIFDLGRSFPFTRAGHERDRIILTKQKRHPLASAQGSVSAGRYILHKRLLGAELVMCESCGFLLPWKDEDKRGVILACFRDSDPSNLTQQNVIALCSWCNSGRVWGRSFPSEWAVMIADQKHIHPSKRKDPHAAGKEMGLPDCRSMHQSDRLEWKPESRLTPWSSRAAVRASASRSRARSFSEIPEDHCNRVESVMHEMAIRLERCIGTPFEVDHVYPLSRGGEHHHTNLRVLPREINSIKADKIDYECHDDFIDIIRIWSGRIFPEKIN